MHFERAISLCSDEVCSSELLLRAQKGLAHCEEESADATMIAYHSTWQSYRPKAPQLVTRQKEIEIGKGDFAEEKQEEISCQLISSPKGLLQLKDTGSLSGWTIELREAVSTVAWMCASSRRHEKHLWGFTVIALYLTYCLHLAGYPMKWFDEVEENMDSFFSTPSPSNCPSRIPASWIAACMLFHIQATSINSFYFENSLDAAFTQPFLSSITLAIPQ
ncbi:hypothetical protein Aperf_G00000084336 [Anoplocephala perfoliata]